MLSSVTLEDRSSEKAAVFLMTETGLGMCCGKLSKGELLQRNILCQVLYKVCSLLSSIASEAFLSSRKTASDSKTGTIPSLRVNVTRKEKESAGSCKMTRLLGIGRLEVLLGESLSCNSTGAGES